MPVTEVLSSLGSWSLTLTEQVPQDVLDSLGYFGHIAIVKGHLDPAAVGDELLKPARYVGVLRGKKKATRELNGSGMVLWLGDEDDKGAGVESKLDLSGKTLAQAVTATLPTSVTAGTINSAAGTLPAGSTFQFQSPRKILQSVCDAFSVEFRVNGDASVDVGTQAQLYQPLPRTDGRPAPVIVRRGAEASDIDLVALGGELSDESRVYDYTSRVVLLGQSTGSSGDSTQFATGTADAASVPYKDLRGNPVKFTRFISESDQATGSVTARAQLQLNRFNRIARALTISTDEYETEGSFAVGDLAYVYDPDAGIADTSRQLLFQGRLIFPDVIRITAATWPISDGHTVAFRAQDGTWIDLTHWVKWEDAAGELTIGDLPNTLSNSTDNPIQMRVDGAPDSSIPNAPTGLTLSTIPMQSTAGETAATITASWTAPAQNTDGSVITDLDYYRVDYRWHTRTAWDTRVTAATAIEIGGLSPGLLYDVQVSAVDTTGHTSAPSAIAQITAAPDTLAPNPPSDPVVGSYLGQLRISWDGKDNTGAAMPDDFNYVEVHVSATSGFTPDSSPGSATLVSELSTAGVAYATAPYGATRYVKLVAVDNSLNRSAPSGQVSGATVQVADGDIASLSVGKLTAGTVSADIVNAGRIATALTGARTELNSVGLQAWNSSGAKTIDLNGVTNLLTGTFQTALTGAKMSMGVNGSGAPYLALDLGNGKGGTLEAYNDGTTPAGILLTSPYTPPSGAGVVGGWNSTWLASGDYSGGFAPAWNAASEVISITYGTVNGGFSVVKTGDQGLTVTGQLYLSDTSFQISNVDNISFYTGASTSRLYFGTSSSQIMFPNGTPGLELDSSGDAYVGGGGGNVWYQWPSTSARLVMLPSDGAGNSPIFQQINPYSYGVNLQFGSNSDGTNSHLAVGDAVSSTFIPVWASAFVVQSDARAKTGITDATDDFLSMIAALPVKRFRRKGPKTHDGTQAPDGPELVGFVAQDMPAQYQVADPATGMLLIDQSQLLAALVGALKQVVSQLPKGKP